jgi:hypothetical protein
MSSTAEFWLDLHRVAAHLRGGGDASSDPIEALAAELESIPPATREVFLRRLEVVLQSLSELHARCERGRSEAANSV